MPTNIPPVPPPEPGKPDSGPPSSTTVNINAPLPASPSAELRVIEDRRAPTTFVVPPASPTWYSGLPKPWQAFIQLGFAGLMALAFVAIGAFVLNMVREDRAERRARDSEEREIRRAEIAQQDRRADQTIMEIRFLRDSVTSAAAEIRSYAVEVRSARTTLDRLMKEFQAVLDKWVKAGKPSGRLPPNILDWFTVELAPMPREVYYPFTADNR